MFSKEKSGLFTYFFTLVMSALETLSLLKVLICVCVCASVGLELANNIVGVVRGMACHLSNDQ